MGYGIRDGDIISLSNKKAGALTMSVDLLDYRGGALDPLKLWETQPAVRSVVDFATTSISSVPFNLYNRRGDNGRIRNYTHPVAAALETPGYKLGGKRFVQQLMLDRWIYDRWAFTIHRLEGGKLEFIRLPAERISIITDDLGRYSQLGIRVNGEMVTRPLDDIVFDVGVGPTTKNRKDGSPALRTLSDLAAELEGMSDYRANLFRNSAMVPAVIERPVEAPAWSDTAWKRFKEDFSTYRAGGGNAGGTPLLEDGMKLVPVDVFNPKDSQYIEVRQLALIEAAQALRIPPELVGAKDGTHSNIVALREQLYVDVLGPEIGYFEDALNVGLKEYMQRNQYIEANLEVRLRGSMAERAKIYQSAVGGPWMSRNEARSRENMEAIEGGDELVTPLNVTEGGQANPQDSAPEDNGQDEKDGQLSADPKGRPASAGSGSKAKTDPLETKRKRFETAMLRWWHAWAKRLADDMGVDLDEDKAATAGTKALPTMPLNDELVDEAAAAAQIIFFHTQGIAELAAENVFVEWNPDRDGFDIERQRAWLAKAAENNSLRLSTGIYEAIAESMQDPNTWEAGVRQVLNSDKDALAWVNGLATEAASWGGYDAARASGLTQKKWITGGNPRESHARLNGVVIGMDDIFANGCRWPGDWYGGFAEVANCNCSMSFTK